LTQNDVDKWFTMYWFAVFFIGTKIILFWILTVQDKQAECFNRERESAALALSSESASSLAGIPARPGVGPERNQTSQNDFTGPRKEGLGPTGGQ